MTYVYKHLDQDGRVLYVGCTMYPSIRTRQHEVGSPWWPQVVRVELSDFYADRDEALARELELIRELDPPNNIEGTPRDTRPWVQRRRQAAAS